MQSILTINKKMYTNNKAQQIDDASTTVDYKDGSERWKVIRDASFYEISTYGRIRRLPSNVIVYDPAKKKSPLVALRTHFGTVTQFHVARLVLETFTKAPSPKHKFVKHLDGSYRNINIQNLEWSDVDLLAGPPRKEDVVVRKKRELVSSHHFKK